MKYAVAAILMLYGLVCLVWPAQVFRGFQGGFSARVSPGYVRGSGLVIRLIGLAMLIGTPLLFLLGLDR